MENDCITCPEKNHSHESSGCSRCGNSPCQCRNHAPTTPVPRQLMVAGMSSAISCPRPQKFSDDPYCGELNLADWPRIIEEKTLPDKSLSWQAKTTCPEKWAFVGMLFWLPTNRGVHKITNISGDGTLTMTNISGEKDTDVPACSPLVPIAPYDRRALAAALCGVLPPDGVEVNGVLVCTDAGIYSTTCLPKLSISDLGDDVAVNPGKLPEGFSFLVAEKIDGVNCMPVRAGALSIPKWQESDGAAQVLVRLADGSLRYLANVGEGETLRIDGGTPRWNTKQNGFKFYQNNHVGRDAQISFTITERSMVIFYNKFGNPFTNGNQDVPYNGHVHAIGQLSGNVNEDIGAFLSGDMQTGQWESGSNTAVNIKYLDPGTYTARAYKEIVGDSLSGITPAQFEALIDETYIGVAVLPMNI